MPMEHNNKIVCVDLGSSKIGVCVASVGTDGKCSIEVYNDYPSSGIKGGRIVNPKSLSEALKTAIGSIEHSLGMKIDSVVVQHQKIGIKEMKTSVSLETSNDSFIDDEGIRNICDIALTSIRNSLSDNEEIFAGVPQSFNTEDEINIEPHNIVGKMGGKIEGSYNVYVGKNINERNIDAAFKNIGIDTVHKVFSPDAQGRCVLTRDEMESGIALIDFGAGAASVSIFYAGSLRHYAAIPFGGSNVTYDIQNICGISNRLAENIKLGFGGCMPDRLLTLGEKKLKIIDKQSGQFTEIPTKYLSEIITARVKEIVEALLYEIQVSGWSDKLKSGVVVTGGCANMLNLHLFIKELSGYTVRTGSPSKDMFIGDNIFFTPSASTSAALILKGCEECLGANLTALQEEEQGESTSLESLFHNDEIKVEETKASEPKKEKAERKPKEKKWAHGFMASFDSLFGDDNDDENKLN